MTVSKCKTIASAFDGILTQYKMFCEDGEVDNELFKYTTNSPRLKDIPSLVKNKYCYIQNQDIQKEINLIFSSQLAYTERTQARYQDFYNLIKSENISVDECQPYNIENINWLISQNTIRIEDGYIRFNMEKLFILMLFKNNSTISMQHIHSQILKEMISNGDVTVKNTLLTTPECDYYNYLLNNSEFSNGKALRNKYIHDTIITTEETMYQDYITFVKLFVILIIKINDDVCLNDDLKSEEDYYEL